MGYIRKALEKGFSEMYGLGLRGAEPCFSENWLLPLTDWVFFLPVLVRFQTDCTAPLSPLPGALFFWGVVEVAPPILGVGGSKIYLSEKVATVGELYEGKIITKWGRTSLLMESYPEW